VPPLDDVTRRRLVSRALDAAGAAAADDGSGTGAATPPGAPRGRRILAVAAGAVAVIAVGAGVISALRDDGGSGSTTVAGQAENERAEDAAPSTSGAGDLGAAEAPATPRASASSVPIDLGDLGDVGDTARLRATVRGALAGGDPQTRYLQDALGAPCSAAAPAGTSTVAVGSGRDQGTPVVVLVVAEELDRFRLLRLDPTTCAVRSDVEL
jgi:hypothetical protein